MDFILNLKDEERKEYDRWGQETRAKPQVRPLQRQKGGKPPIKEYAKAMATKPKDVDRMPPPKPKSGEKPPAKKETSTKKRDASHSRPGTPRPILEERKVYRVPSPARNSSRGDKRYERRQAPYPRMYAANQWMLGRERRSRREEYEMEAHLKRKHNIKPPRAYSRRR